MPISPEKPSVELVKVTDEMKSFKAKDKLHNCARMIRNRRCIFY